MATLAVGVTREAESDERRVAVVPDDVGALAAAGLTVLVESGAGTGAFIADETYAHAGAEVVSAAELVARADVLVCLTLPSIELITSRIEGLLAA